MSVLPLNSVIVKTTGSLSAVTTPPAKGIPVVDLLSYYLMGPILNLNWQFQEDVLTAPGDFTAVASTDICTLSSHGFITGLKVRVSNSGGALPGGLAAATNYYVIKIDANTFYLAESLIASTNALAFINLTTNGTGTNTITPQAVAASAGSGIYLLTLPESLVIDSNFINIGTGVYANNVGHFSVLDTTAVTPLEGNGHIVAYNSTSLAMVFNKAFVASDYLGLNSANKPTIYSVRASVPVTNRNYLY